MTGVIAPYGLKAYSSKFCYRCVDLDEAIKPHLKPGEWWCLGDGPRIDGNND